MNVRPQSFANEAAMTTGSDASVRVKLLGNSATKVKGRKKKNLDAGSKLKFIEGMRAVAALYVLLGHICTMVDAKFIATGKSQVSPWLHALMTPFWHGHLAVAAFIVLSGFSLQYGLYLRGDGRVYGLGKFFWRRGLRILPAYYACLAFSVWVCRTVTEPNGAQLPFSSYLPVDDGALWSHIFLVHNWNPAWMFKINGVLWSIGIEAQLYLLFPWLILIMQKASPKWLFGIVGTPAILIAASVPGAAKIYSWFALLFVAGMISAHYCFRPDPKRGHRPKLAAWTTSIGVVATALIVNYSLSQGRPFDALTLIISDLSFGFATAAFLYFATVQPGTWIEKVFSQRWLVRVGVFSYSLYLLHHPLLQALFVYRPEFANSLDQAFFYLLIVGVPAILLVTYVFSLIFERPFVKSTIAAEENEQVRKVPIQVPLVPVVGIEWAPFGARASYAYLSGQDEPDLKSVLRSQKSKSNAGKRQKGEGPNDPSPSYLSE